MRTNDCNVTVIWLVRDISRSPSLWVQVHLRRHLHRKNRQHLKVAFLASDVPQISGESEENATTRKSNGSSCLRHLPRRATVDVPRSLKQTPCTTKEVCSRCISTIPSRFCELAAAERSDVKVVPKEEAVSPTAFTVASSAILPTQHAQEL